MCLRYTLTNLVLAAFQEELEAAAATAGVAWRPRYNAALTQRMPVITRRKAKPVLESLAFGLTLPARAPGDRLMILGNARTETLLAKPAFRDAAQHRRCLVPADGFYEWEKSGRARLPHYYYLKDHQPFFFAGLWQPETEATPAAFAIVTTEPNTLVRAIHDRMPVILGPNSGPEWLGDRPLEPARLARLCRPLPADRMTGHRVDPRMNSARHESPDCVAPLNSV